MQVPRFWREIPKRYRLEAGKCSKCGYISFPQRLICPECGSQEFEKMNLKKYFVIADSKNAGITKLSETEVIIKENHVLVPKKSSAVITCL